MGRITCSARISTSPPSRETTSPSASPSCRFRRACSRIRPGPGLYDAFHAVSLPRDASYGILVVLLSVTKNPQTRWGAVNMVDLSPPLLLDKYSSRGERGERKARRPSGAVQQGASRRREDSPRPPMQGPARSELPTARQRAQLAVS